MSEYRAPLHDIAFLLKQVFPFDTHATLCGMEVDIDTALAIVEEAGNFARGCLDPINRIGDREGARWNDSAVTTPAGFRDAYREFAEGGWNGLKFPEEFGGQSLSQVLATVVDEMWHGANMSFALCPMLTNGAIEALLTAGSDALQSRYVPMLVSGKWTGTMNLTEPQAGSDLAAIKTKAVPQQDGSYLITGQKIFITYGEHDLTENIIHLVLARTPDAPGGVKGISLFVVPKFLLNEDGSLGARNDVRCASLEHKLGIHASPTAVMQFGENNGATGYLVGEENRGLEYMFIMMNEARFSVGIQGLAISERAYQHAVWYAKQRVQGRIVGDDGSKGNTILRHPDVRRLLLSMRSRIEAMRALAVFVAQEKDVSHLAPDEDGRRHAREKVEFLVPVIKGWFTETAQEITRDALQVFGGMGFIEETGAAQYCRDARITTIYEGTTAIQANDLLGRKTLRDRGAVALRMLGTILRDALYLRSANPAFAQSLSDRLAVACSNVQDVVGMLVDTGAADARTAYAGAAAYLEMWGILAGGWMHARRLMAASESDLPPDTVATIEASACFYAEHVLPRMPDPKAVARSASDAFLRFPDSHW